MYLFLKQRSGYLQIKGINEVTVFKILSDKLVSVTSMIKHDMRFRGLVKRCVGVAIYNKHYTENKQVKELFKQHCPCQSLTW